MKSKNILFYGVLLCVFLWTTLIYISFAHNHAVLKSEKKNATLLSAKNYAEFILLARHWNATNNGVYVPITKQTATPTGLKQLPKKDLITQDGQKLALVTPTYMTRQFSEIASEAKGVQFRLTTLSPHNIENTPEPFEEDILRSFQRGQTHEYHREEEHFFYYLTALPTRSSCISCHNELGYHDQGRNSGISIRIPYDNSVPFMPIARNHLLIYLAGLAGLAIAFTQLRKAYHTIEQQAITDATTNIPNKRAFSQQFEREFSRSIRSQKTLALILCDIDYFKAYNDSYGHHQGDSCLHKVAQAIATTPERPGDFFARYGGEEFVLLLPETDLQGAQFVAEKIRQKILSMKICHQNSSTSDYVTASFGVAVCQQGECTQKDQLFIQADEALYKAKNLGRNIVAVFTKNHQEQRIQPLQGSLLQ